MMRTALLLALAGCGYTAERDRGHVRLVSGALPRVAVVPFDNETFRRGLEIRLSRLVSDEIRSRSPRTAVRPSEADWLLRGTITRADERILSEDRDDRIRQSSFVVTVEVVLEERATEKVLGNTSFTEREPFSPRAGRIATADQAREEALRDLAERIVYWLEGQSSESS